MNPSLLTVTRLGVAGCLATTAVIHAQLYVEGYRVIPVVGLGFLVLASGCAAVAVLLALSAVLSSTTGGEVQQRLAAALSLGALGGFLASRTIGIAGFVEYGLQPAPQALLSVLVEVVALGLLAASRVLGALRR